MAAWLPVDIAALLEGDLRPLAPSIYCRVDGQHLLYAGFIHSFVGPSESLKSWAALLVCVQEIERGHHVFYFDYEDTPESVLIRLLGMGLSPAQLVQFFHYYNPDSLARLETTTEMLTLVLAYGPTVAVIDGVTEAMTIQGLEIGDNTAIAKWLEALPRRLKALGCAVVTIDHTPHSSKGRAIGGQHKRAGIDALYVFDNTHALSQAEDAPVTGVSRILVSKDRHGGVRAHAVDKLIGSLHVTAHPDTSIFARIIPPEGGDRDLNLMVLVSKALEDGPRSGRQIREVVPGRGSDIDQAVRTLVSEGFVTREDGPRNAQIHTLVTPFTGEITPPWDPWDLDYEDE